MNSKGHNIVHDVIAIGNRVKNFIDERLFGFGGDILEAKVIIRCSFMSVGGKETNYFTYFLIHN